MKLKFLPIFTFLSLGAFAQSFFPSVYDLPTTGFDLLRDQNAVILSQIKASSGNGFENQTLFESRKSPNTPYWALNKVSIWENAKWNTQELTTDSFVLNTQGKITTVYELVNYNYTGFNYNVKNRYNYTYDALGRLSKITMETANPASSNNYRSSYSMNTIYDMNGVRVYDSLYSYANSSVYIRGYVHDAAKKLINEYAVQGVDTITKVTYTYNGNLIKHSVSMSLNTSSDEWYLDAADTFVYNIDNQIDSRISWAMVYTSANSGTFTPTTNETYKYKTGNKLSEIISKQFIDTAWNLSTKTIINYNADNKVIDGYIFDFVNNDWSNNASQKYIFSDEIVGLKESTLNNLSAKIYPNPAADYIEIQVNQTEFMSYELIDISGKMVMVGEVLNKLDISNLETGIYFMKIINLKTNQCITQKIIKQ